MTYHESLKLSFSRRGLDDVGLRGDSDGTVTVT
jgi:hypothetical protein